jgi:hypothetical protein
VDHWIETGMLRPVPDRDVVAAFLMVNDLALLMLREPLTEVLGVDPLSPDGMDRWVSAVLTVYRDGLFAPAADTGNQP